MQIYVVFKTAVFWVVALYSLVEVFASVVLPASIIKAITHRPGDGGSKYILNDSKILQVYTELKPRRQPSPYLSP
jgi:hypothetical protein